MNTDSCTQWQRAPLPWLSTEQCHWLFLPGSLTLHLKALGQYRLELIDQYPTQACVADAQALGIAAGTPLWVRTVLMRLDQRPCVLARSIAPLGALDQGWAVLDGYGSQPLGMMLYQDPDIVRGPFEWGVLALDEPLGRLSRCLDDSGPWLARRSLFHRHGAPLLIAECFLSGFWHHEGRAPSPAARPLARPAGALTQHL
ncbi:MULTISPECIES: chorismate--pyruvate lyase family protein [unclassified Pseudomonas]|jgi:chorismate--pyruvate lyase|uniref:chorismate--pyruvate lyase family protein n=1 Tax=unclassified Pseudomonas TaxID=196821 RepID=UPI001E4A5BB8|nr:MULTISPECIES: chorismate lyase [unclassified Pseudomonas]MDC0687727.1 chorismate lyase [Mitsuaria sp. RG]MCE0917378.1 chorismate lyase [Pseudomonas sp. NMI760_13]MCF1488007.1 chorismate lyase [Pseudomonas sp. AA27]MCP8635154.1 chorismate lyase [Pseudomonas sp. DVZ6]MDD7785887.1 chorismate lyase [Pseudomonas sp. DVZ24]